PDRAHARWRAQTGRRSTVLVVEWRIAARGRDHYPADHLQRSKAVHDEPRRVLVDHGREHAPDLLAVREAEDLRRTGALVRVGQLLDELVVDERRGRLRRQIALGHPEPEAALGLPEHAVAAEAVG